MPTLPQIILKPGKDTPIRAGHPWIFSHAIETEGGVKPGDLVEIRSSKGDALGVGYWNPNTSIRVRILSRDPKEAIDAAFFTKRFEHLDAWKRAHLPEKTDGFRLVHAEADGLPGLIVDRYADTIVFQLHTFGMDRLRAEIIEGLKAALQPKNIIERSDISVRAIEGLKDQPIFVHLGDVTEPVPFQEAGLTFYADVLKGQKTGFFLDQREARMHVGALAKGRRVLNLFGYTGAFSVHAAKGGATFVATVDASEPALEIAEKNFLANGLETNDEKKSLFLKADVLELLQDAKPPGAPYDLIICDPPAFAKNERQLPRAIKAYTDLNQACLTMLRPGGILVTSSCSGRLEPEAFRSLLRIAAGRAGRDVKVLDALAQPADHAERLAFPEGRYLKTVILEVV